VNAPMHMTLPEPKARVVRLSDNTYGLMLLRTPAGRRLVLPVVVGPVTLSLHEPGYKTGRHMRTIGEALRWQRCYTDRIVSLDMLRPIVEGQID
jgi:hypothetical protein